MDGSCQVQECNVVLLGSVDANVMVLASPPHWTLTQVRRVLVPVRGRRDQSLIRARLLGSIGRGNSLGGTYLGMLEEGAPAKAIASKCELVVMGTQRLGRRQKLFRDTPIQVARECGCGVLLISRRG